MAKRALTAEVQQDEILNRCRIVRLAKSAIVEHGMWVTMRTLSAKEAKYEFGKLIDLARASPVVVAKHGRPVVVVISIEEYERLLAFEPDQPRPAAERAIRK